ncbi:MAG: DNA polymerase III subunit gamma/tau [Leptolyngbyaceae bacterium]|nr:DNA polymerase III subunit gamma/tau [Leptolyngbyaceae bacterium]
MTYEPLHHKYRPQTFAQLVGQEAIATTLSHALRQQRIAPAYLFTGPRGTGKTSSARILAKSLNCLQSDVPTEEPCGECETCQMIARGAALDVIEIDAASNTGVDNIRELIERAQFAPVQCRYKVYIIDEVHMLSTAAFNALLKTLEEPPGRVVFVLATTDPQRVLPTIISRCQRFDYRRIPLDAMVQHLGAIAQNEDIDIADDALELVAQIAQGGLRDAESLLDQLSLLDGQITVERVWDLVGAVPERDLLALVKAIAQDDGTTVLDQARHLMNRGREPLVVLQNLASFYRDLLIAKTAGDRRDLVTLTQPTWDALCVFAQMVEMGMILLGQQHLRESEVQVKNTTQPRLWLEITLMGLLPSTLAGMQSSGIVSAAPSPSSPPVAAPVMTRPSGAPAASSAVPSSPPTRPIASTPDERDASASPTMNTPSNGAFSNGASSLPSAPPARMDDAAANADTPAATPLSSNEQPSPTPPEVVTPPDPTTPLANNAGYIAAQQEKLDQTWSQVIAAMKPLAQALLKEHGCLLSFDGRMARVGISSRPLIGIAQSKQRNIEEAFEKVYGTKIVISLEVGTSPTAGRKSPSVKDGGAASLQNVSGKIPDSAIAPPSSSSPPEPPTNPPPPTGHSVAAPAPQSNPPAVSPDAGAAFPSPTSDQASPEETPDALSPKGWQQEDEVTRAAKSLAQMFNGAIVNLDDEDDENPSDASSSKGEKNSRSRSSSTRGNGHRDTDGSPESLPGHPPVDLDSLPASTRKRPINLDDVPF